MTTIMLDWTSDERITYGECYTEIWGYFTNDTTDHYDIGLMYARQYARKTDAEILPGPARFFDPGDSISPAYLVFPVAMVKK